MRPRTKPLHSAQTPVIAMKSLSLKLRLLLTCLTAAVTLPAQKAAAAGSQDFAYSLSRLAASNTLQQLPGTLWAIYAYAYGTTAGLNPYVAQGQFYLGAGRLNSSSAYQQGQYYGAYYKYLGVVNAIQTGNNSAFNGYYNPVASFYVDYYNDYAEAVAGYYTSVAGYYLSAGGVGTHVIYGAPLNAISETPGDGFAFGNYSPVLTGGGNGSTNLWNFSYSQGNYANVSPNTGTYYFQYGQYVGGSVSWQYTNVYLSAANAAYLASYAYNNNSAACFYNGLMARYQGTAIMAQYNNVAFYYLFLATFGSQFNNYYEGLAYDAAASYASSANSTMSNYLNACYTTYLNSGVTLR